jgi:hypothetical protein
MLHIYACCKNMFQVFLGVSYVCLQGFHLDVAYVCNDFQMFFTCFSQVFQMLVLSVSFVFFLYVATIVCGCFKSRSSIAYEIRVGSGWRREQRLGWSGTTAGALPYEPDALDARSPVANLERNDGWCTT